MPNVEQFTKQVSPVLLAVMQARSATTTLLYFLFGIRSPWCFLPIVGQCLVCIVCFFLTTPKGMTLATGIRMSNTHDSGSLCVYFKVYLALGTLGVAHEVLPNPWYLQCNFLSITFYQQYVSLVAEMACKIPGVPHWTCFFWGWHCRFKSAS